ncbi:MAG: hypothetical protein ACTHL3_07630, partial [Candidatus Nitrosocosmicus sp.]
MKPNLLYTLIGGIDGMFAPLYKGSTSDDDRNIFFAKLGWDFSLIPNFPISLLVSSLATFETAESNLTDYLVDLPESFTDIVALLSTIKNQFDSFNGIATSINSSTAINADVKTEFNTLSGELFDFLLALHLERTSPTINALLEIVGVITRTVKPNKYDSSSNLIRNSYETRSVNFSNFKKLIQNNLSYISSLYFPPSHVLSTIADANTFSNTLFPKIDLLFRALSFETYYGIDPSYSSMFTTDEYNSGQKLFLARRDDGTGNYFGLAFNMSSVAEGNLGLVVSPIGSLNFTQSFGIWDIVFSSNTALTSISIKDNKITFPSSFADSTLKFNISLSDNVKSDDPDYSFWNLTINDSIELNINGLSATFNLETDQDKNVIYKFEFSIDDGSLTIQKTDTDNFINSLIPNDGLEVDFNFTIGYSSTNGLYIGGGAGFEANIPIHQTILGVDFSNILLSAKVSNGEIPISIATSFNVSIGPLNISVTNIGIRGTLSFPGSGGNLGKMNFDTSFKPPTGLG